MYLNDKRFLYKANDKKIIFYEFLIFTDFTDTVIIKFF